ncbi:MAG: hypothetical protein N3B10_11575, partial [Armatimonadetes bacterium]|nr:hypothetical protein [Armatimonadota bacterium]
MLLVGEFGQWVKEAFVEANGVDLREAKQVVATGKTVHAIVKSGLVEFDGETWKANNADWSNPPSLLLSRRDGSVWVYDGEQIWMWDGERWRAIRKLDALTAWAEDEFGNVWLVAENTLWRFQKVWERATRIPFNAEIRSIACWRDQV